jgi:hypothetical protein
MWCIEKIICMFYNILQKISSQKSFLWESENDHKKDCIPWIFRHCWLIWLWSHPWFVFQNIMCIGRNHIISKFFKWKFAKRKTSMLLHTNFSLRCKKWSSFFSLHWDTILLLRCWIWQVHMTNLTIQTLSHLPLMFSIENML